MLKPDARNAQNQPKLRKNSIGWCYRRTTCTAISAWIEYLSKLFLLQWWIWDTSCESSLSCTCKDMTKKLFLESSASIHRCLFYSQLTFMSKTTPWMRKVEYNAHKQRTDKHSTALLNFWQSNFKQSFRTLYSHLFNLYYP